MELCSLSSLKRSSSILPRTGFLEKPLLLHAPPIIKILPFKPTRINNTKFVHCRAQAKSGVTTIGSEAPGAATEDVDSKDNDLVFVAGATGRVGSLTVRELLKLGFRVKAGVRSRQRAESLVQSVRRMKLDDSASGGTQAIENLEIVECDLEKDRIVPAIGSASVVICCIGASEKEVFDITGPYRIDYQATKNLIDAATSAKVDHFILLTSLGTNKFGFPAAILNLFWGVLCWKRRAEEALLASGLPYTIVRPGGMERPTDSYKETHNLMLSEEDTLFGGQVSNLQVAELMAFMAQNRSLSYFKVVEVIAETTAPLTPIGELLAKIPSKRVEVTPPPKVPETKASEPPSPPVVKESSPAKPTPERPLSPYTAYEDLKPPTSPSPMPSSSTGGTIAGSAKTAVAAPDLSTSVIEINSSAAPRTVIESEKISFLSPYPNYDDLKPPTSPTPSQPSGFKSSSESAFTRASGVSEARSVTQTEAKPSDPESITTQPQTRPLSPYTAYEDLKPPTSPSPTPSGPKEASNGAPISLNIESQERIGIVSSVPKDPPPSPASRLSPYLVYEDLKPPSSPSPSAPVVSGNNKPVPLPVGNSEAAKEDFTTVKPQALSPYTMYEDLKPPSSPAPSLKKL